MAGLERQRGIFKMKQKGFYVCGSFRRGKKAFGWVTKEKPFEFDDIEGTVSSKMFDFTEKGKIWFSEWQYVERLSDKKLLTDEEVQIAEDVYREMCNQHGRAYVSMFKDEK
jgi:hypothetical protein